MKISLESWTKLEEFREQAQFTSEKQNFEES